jgi:hypothetical protein
LHHVVEQLRHFVHAVLIPLSDPRFNTAGGWETI